jgi:hypothetical protein
MASLVESLMTELESRGAVDQIAGKLGVAPGQASSALTAAVPTILAGLAKNAQQSEGRAALAGALERDHDGSVLDDDQYFESYQERKGDKILGHVFGEKEPAVESQVSAAAGLNMAQGADLMKMLAPLVMGYLGKQKSSGSLDLGSLAGMLGGGGAGGGLNLPGGLGDLLGGLSGGAPATSGGAAKSSGGLGGLLGKIFGRK